MEQKYYIGASAIEHFAEVLAQLGVKSVFVVRGRQSYVQCGAEAQLQGIFDRLAIQCTYFSNFSPNPKKEEVDSAVVCVRESGAHCIVAVGGGSAMDVAKLVRHQLAEGFYQASLLAIPTTAGTGAEATHFSVVYVDGVKNSFEAEDILPDYAFVYAPYTYGNSTYLTACTGMDALAQAFESYWNRNANDESRAFALKAIDMLWTAMPQLVQSPTEQLRNVVSEGAYWAGRAINITKTTAPHAFSYAFTSHCGYPHGHAVALTFPFFFALNLSADDPVIQRVGLNPNQSLSEQLYNYVREIGLVYTGCKDCQLSDLLAMVNLQRLKNNPVEVDQTIIARLKDYLETHQS